MAIGILVVPLERLLQKSRNVGWPIPISTPANIARKIHNVRYLSRNLSLLFDGIIVKIYGKIMWASKILSRKQ